MHKVLKLAQVNTQMEQPRRAMPKVHKLVLVELQTPQMLSALPRLVAAVGVKCSL